MDPITQQTILGAAGAGGGKTYVDDVFSTFLYDGTGAAQTITNKINLSGEGGLVWIKQRGPNDGSHILTDSVRGVTWSLKSDSANDQEERTGTNSKVSSFNTNGFSIGANNDVNNSTQDYASWSFRKAPGFFDVVTYTGSGTADRAIAHNLGSVPGMVIVKRTNGVNNWFTYHRSLASPLTKWLSLNRTDGEQQANVGTNMWGSMTSTHIGVRDYFGLNAVGGTFVAYIFAHDDAQFGTGGDESIIKCGSFTHSTSSGNEINLGFEPQWLLYKKSSDTSHWYMWDTIRGWDVDSQSNLKANEPTAESTGSNTAAGWPQITSTGFKLGTNNYAGDGATYVYMAIRRPHKPPESGTEVFAIDTRGGTSPNPPTFNSGFPVDLVTRRDITVSDWNTRTRLLGYNKLLQFNTTAAENTQSSTTITFDRNDGVGTNTGVDGANYAWMFKRAPGFFDVVAWTGDGAAVKNVAHNLEKVPEMVITKMRTYSGGGSYGGDRWYVYHKNVTGMLSLNSNASIVNSDIVFNSTPTATNLPFDNPGYDSLAVNGNNDTYVGYLFATLAGISKVGTYNGTSGSAHNVDCGFTNGARFVMIKRSNGTGDWYVWDSLRGIVSGQEPYLLINSTAGQGTGNNYINPNSAGFRVTSLAPAALNATGGTYIFLAIA